MRLRLGRLRARACRPGFSASGGSGQTAEVVVEPVGEEGAVGGDCGPRFAAVLGTGARDEHGVGADGGGALDEVLGLLDRHERIGVAVDDERGRGFGGNETGGGELFTEALAALGGGNVGAEGRRVILEDAHADGDFTVATVVEEIGGRIKTGDGLNGAAGAVDGVFGVGLAGAALRAEREREMSAGAGTGDAEAVGVDLPAGGVCADEADGAVNIGHNFGEDKFGLRTVDDGENGVATGEKRGVGGRVDSIVRGLPAAADDGDDRVAVGFDGGGLNDVERESDAEFAPVDDVFGARVGRRARGSCGRGWRLGEGSPSGGDEEERDEEAGEFHRSRRGGWRRERSDGWARRAAKKRYQGGAFVTMKGTTVCDAVSCGRT